MRVKIENSGPLFWIDFEHPLYNIFDRISKFQRNLFQLLFDHNLHVSIA